MQEKKIRCLVCHVPLSLHHSLLSEMTITSLPSNEISASHLSGSSLLLSIESNDDSVSGTETDHTIIDKKYTEKNECASTSSASAYIDDKHVERPTLIFDDLEFREEVETMLAKNGENKRTAIVPTESGNLLDLICYSTNPLDVPMCQKCAETLQCELDRQLERVKTECESYQQSLDDLLARRNMETKFDEQSARRKLELLQLEENELSDELMALENEDQALSTELDKKINERKQMAAREEQFYRQLRDNHRTLLDQGEEQRSLKMQLRSAEDQLQRLQRINVLDMVFFIWMDGEYGTINGLRLGRLKNDHVEWHEINAAFGQVAFLTQVITEQLEMKLSDLEIVPCASYSFIRARKSNGKMEELPLYGSGGWRPFGQTGPGLDQAIVALLDCISQIEKQLQRYFPPGTQILPYRIANDKIIDKDAQYLCKMQLNAEERWTKAMKCMLLNLKRIISIMAMLTNNGTLSQHTVPQAQSTPPTTTGRNREVQTTSSGE